MKSMKRLTWFAVGLLFLGWQPAVAETCQSGNPGSLAYIRRDGNRCEGLLDHHNVSGRFDLIGFYTSTLTQEYPNTMTIQVPGTGNLNPRVEVQSFFRNYRLDQLELRSRGGIAKFDLDTQILRKASVPVGALRALAYTVPDSSKTYFPVILEKPAAQYQFVLYSPQRQEFPTLEIRRNGQVVRSDSRRIPTQGQFHFTWEYGNAPAGTYELHVVNGEGRRRVFRFRHNPNWF
ncbi:hypothetical protein [Geitlerinema sp. PCC 9228]|uniref:hypothetical protein n=1 Tax=Geitlerinema sp. PCC 9228 TaxID=111611 RepID=UPI001114FF4C|nr:hypothetical protein [Geitlerinema sp. PCC 9228]